MPEERVERWYWIMDENSRQSILRGGRLSNTKHNDFLISDINISGIAEELDKSFRGGKKPRLEYKEIELGRNRKKIIVTGVIPERE